MSYCGDSVCEVFEEDLQRLLSKGFLFQPHGMEHVKMEPSKCHRNSATFWKNYTEKKGFGRIKIATGWALLDNIWRQHSWIYFADDKNIIETTPNRWDNYFGSLLTDDEAEEFYWNNR